MKYRSVIIIPFAMVLLLAAAVLTGRRPARDAAGRPIVIYAHPPCPPDLMAFYNPLFEQFRDEHPDIDFRVLHITGNYEDKIKIMFAGNVAPDVIFMYPTALPAWVRLNALAPLNDLMAARDEVGPDTYFSAAMETFSYDGAIYGLPKDASASVLFYNVALFEKHGVTPPQPDWTWDDLLQAAKALTRDTDGDGRFEVYGLYSLPWWICVWQNGGRILSADGSRCLLLEPKAMGGLEFWSSLRNRHQVTPAPETASDLSVWRMFSLQRVAMFTSMYPAVAILRKQCDFPWDIEILPAGPAGRQTDFVGSALAVTSQCRNRGAAFEWVRWMTMEGMHGVMNFELPSYQALGRSSAWTSQPAPPPSKAAAVRIMNHARPPIQHPDYGEIMDAIQPELDRVLRGTATVHEAMERAVPRVDAVLQRRLENDS